MGTPSLENQCVPATQIYPLMEWEVDNVCPDKPGPTLDRTNLPDSFQSLGQAIALDWASSQFLADIPKILTADIVSGSLDFFHCACPTVGTDCIDLNDAEHFLHDSFGDESDYSPLTVLDFADWLSSRGLDIPPTYRGYSILPGADREPTETERKQGLLREILAVNRWDKEESPSYQRAIDRLAFGALSAMLEDDPGFVSLAHLETIRQICAQDGCSRFLRAGKGVDSCLDNPFEGEFDFVKNMRDLPAARAVIDSWGSSTEANGARYELAYWLDAIYRLNRGLEQCYRKGDCECEIEPMEQTISDEDADDLLSEILNGN